MVHFTTESGEAPPWDVSLKGEKESTFPWRERERSRVGDLNLNHFHYLREKALWFQVLRTVVRKKTECGVWILSISPVLQTSRTRLETTLMIIFTRCLRSCLKIIHTGSDDTNEVNFLWRKPFLFKMMKTFFIRGNISQKLQSKWLGCLVFYFFTMRIFCTLNLEVQRITLGSGIILTPRVTYWLLYIPHYLLLTV